MKLAAICFTNNGIKVLKRLGALSLFKDDNITERTFGKYVSVYDFKRAVEDGATVHELFRLLSKTN